MQLKRGGDNGIFIPLAALMRSGAIKFEINTRKKSKPGANWLLLNFGHQNFIIMLKPDQGLIGLLCSGASGKSLKEEKKDDNANTGLLIVCVFGNWNLNIDLPVAEQSIMKNRL
jgi:hypothetical protein